MLLTSGYALGLGIPFLLIGFVMDQATSFIRRFEIVNGILLIGIGLLMVTNKMILISIWTQQNGIFIDLPFGRSAEPT